MVVTKFLCHATTNVLCKLEKKSLQKQYIVTKTINSLSIEEYDVNNCSVRFVDTVKPP